MNLLNVCKLSLANNLKWTQDCKERIHTVSSYRTNEKEAIQVAEDHSAQGTAEVSRVLCNAEIHFVQYTVRCHYFHNTIS